MQFQSRLIATLKSTLVFIACYGTALGQTNVLTYHNDNARTGQNLSETILTPGTVQSSTFGRLFTVQMDGKVDAQPLYVSAVNIPGQGTHSVVYAETEHDSVYAFDARTGQVYWQLSLLGSGETPSDDRGCGQVTPEIGITGTPVIDLNAGPNGAIYMVAMSKDASGYYQRLHALDLTTGGEQFGGPIQVNPQFPGYGDGSRNGTVLFDAGQYKSRPGLLLLNGTVYTAWGSHCDIRPYTGWIVGYDELSLAQNQVFNFAPNGSEAAVWASGGGVASDSAGNIFVSVANGDFDTTLTPQGFPSRGNYGNSFVKLSLSNGPLGVADYWTMDNTVAESSRDVDLGSGGLTLLPDVLDANGNIRHLGTGAGKDRNVYVFDRDRMGGFDPADNSTLYQQLPNGLNGGEFATPAWFNGTVYYGASGDVIRAFTLNQGLLNASPSSSTAAAFQYPGITPSISASGLNNPILWAVENSTPAVLHAYDATNLGTELYNSNQAASRRDQFGPGNKFITPTIADGEVFVGTTNSVAVFGMLNQGPLPDGDYVLTNQSSSLVLDDPEFSNVSGQSIMEFIPNGGANQKWHFAIQNTGAYTIQNVSSGLYLTNPGGGTPYQAAQLQQQTSNGNASQLWALTPSGSNWVIHNKAENVVIDDPEFSNTPGTMLIVWGPNGGANQSWSISPSHP